MLDPELASAMPVPKQSNEKPAAVAHRARHHRTLHVRVACDDALVALIFFPRDIAVMVGADEHLPLIALPHHAAGDHVAPALEPYSGTGAAEDIT